MEKFYAGKHIAHKGEQSQAFKNEVPEDPKELIPEDKWEGIRQHSFTWY